MKTINLFGIGGHYNVIKEIAIHNGYKNINLTTMILISLKI